MNARKFDLMDVTSMIHQHKVCARICDTLHAADLKYKLAPEILAAALFDLGIEVDTLEDRIQFGCDTWDVIVTRRENWLEEQQT